MSVHARTTRFFWLLLIILIAGIWRIPAGIAEDQDNNAPVDQNSSVPEVRFIEPVPAFNPEVAIQSAEHRTFNGKGVIDGVDQNTIIIDGVSHPLVHSGVAAGFYAGNLVGFKLNGSGEVVELQVMSSPTDK